MSRRAGEEEGLGDRYWVSSDCGGSEGVGGRVGRGGEGVVKELREGEVRVWWGGGGGGVVGGVASGWAVGGAAQLHGEWSSGWRPCLAASPLLSWCAPQCPCPQLWPLLLVAAATLWLGTGRPYRCPHGNRETSTPL